MTCFEISVEMCLSPTISFQPDTTVVYFTNSSKIFQVGSILDSFQIEGQLFAWFQVVVLPLKTAILSD